MGSYVRLGHVRPLGASQGLRPEVTKPMLRDERCRRLLLSLQRNDSGAAIKRLVPDATPSASLQVSR